MTDIVELKRRAAEEAVREVRSGQALGLGTGSTSEFAIHLIGEAYRAGRLERIVGVATSEAAATLARSYGIPLAELTADTVLDLAIDGADEVSPALDLIKGLGGALLREKAVELRARRFIVIVDQSKQVPKLGTRAPLPIEVSPADAGALQVALTKISAPALRLRHGAPFITDNGNQILDCRFRDGIDDPWALAAQLDADPRVRAHGLFLGMAGEVIVAAADGILRLQRTR